MSSTGTFQGALTLLTWKTGLAYFSGMQLTQEQYDRIANCFPTQRGNVFPRDVRMLRAEQLRNVFCGFAGIPVLRITASCVRPSWRKASQSVFRQYSQARSAKVSCRKKSGVKFFECPRHVLSEGLGSFDAFRVAGFHGTDGAAVAVVPVAGADDEHFVNQEEVVE